MDADAASHVLCELRALGLRIAVDDFGTEYSAMSYLATFPIDVLTVDRSFVTAMNRSEQGHALVLTLLRLARDLGLETIAEGIESHGQLAQLRDLGSTMGQGFLMGPPAGAASVGILRTSLPGPWAAEPAGAEATPVAGRPSSRRGPGTPASRDPRPHGRRAPARRQL